MRIVFIGSTSFGLRCLREAQSLIDCDIIGVVTAHQTFSISYRPEGVLNVLYTDIAGYCQRNNLPHIVMQHNMKDERLFNMVRYWQPDIFLVAGWYHIIPKRWRDLAPAYGLHASLLPDYSGGAPLVWAIINGEDLTGITFFKFDNGVDSGPIIGQAETIISHDDTIGTLYSRIEELSIELIKTHLPLIAHGKAKMIPQDESKRRFFPQRSPDDGKIDWNQEANKIYNFIRAQTKPYPGAFTTLKGKKITIWKAMLGKKQPNISCVAGEILTNATSTFVNTGNGIIEVIEVTYDRETFTGNGLGKVFFEREILGT